MVAAAVLVGAALLATGCGGASAGGQAAGSSAYQKALPYAQCMRSHGIGNFPDPDSNGNFPNPNVPYSPQYAKAQSTCVKLHPYNLVLSPPQATKMMAQALKYSRCMRAHGVPNFPDPTQGNNGIAFGGQTSVGSATGQGGAAQPTASTGKGGSARPTASTSIGSSGPSESPQYQAANQACQSYMAGVK